MEQEGRVNEEGINHLQNMSVRQSRIFKGDTRFYVQTANGWVVRGPFDKRDDARAALELIREQAWEEHDEELAELEEGAA